MYIGTKKYSTVLLHHYYFLMGVEHYFTKDTLQHKKTYNTLLLMQFMFTKLLWFLLWIE